MSEDRKLSARGLALIRQFEGLRLTPYQDAVGKWTVGYGHLMAEGEARTPITAMRALELLAQDTERAQACVREGARVELTQGQFDALVSFAYNLGCGALKASTLLRLLNNGHPDKAALEFEKWNHAGGRELPGLTRRRKAEAALFSSPDAEGVPPELQEVVK